MSNDNLSNLFKDIFHVDFFITHNNYDEVKLFNYDLNSTFLEKSDFIFKLSVIMLSNQLIKLNKPSLNEKNKGKYSLKEFCEEILELEFGKSAYSSKKSIVGRVTSFILLLNNDDFFRYSHDVNKKILIKLKENFVIEDKPDVVKKTKNKKIKLSDIDNILK